MNIGNSSIINTRLRTSMIMTEIKMNMRISNSMNMNSNMHIDTHIIIKIDINNVNIKYE